MGRLSEEKCLDVVIQALGSVKELWEFHVIGDGEQNYKEFLVQTAKENGICSRIHWYGRKEKPWSYAQDADAFVWVSEYEGFPVSVIEAQARGIPVIVTPVSGLTELIKPGVEGFYSPLSEMDLDGNSENRKIFPSLLILQYGIGDCKH